jgi:(p)ppGpp synthase/HD superfamily hydrolase
MIDNAEYINKAIAFAKEKHHGQKRQDGRDYFTHLEAVADIAKSKLALLRPSEHPGSYYYDSVIAAAYLHDVVEDRHAHIRIQNMEIYGRIGKATRG